MGNRVTTLNTWATAALGYVLAFPDPPPPTTPPPPNQNHSNLDNESDGAPLDRIFSRSDSAIHTTDNEINDNYLRMHRIPQLFDELTNRLLTEKPLDPLLFLRNLLIHKVVIDRDLQRRKGNTTPLQRSITPRLSGTSQKLHINAALTPVGNGTSLTHLTPQILPSQLKSSTAEPVAPHKRHSHDYYDIEQRREREIQTITSVFALKKSRRRRFGGKRSAKRNGSANGDDNDICTQYASYSDTELEDTHGVDVKEIEDSISTAFQSPTRPHIPLSSTIPDFQLGSAKPSHKFDRDAYKIADISPKREIFPTEHSACLGGMGPDFPRTKVPLPTQHRGMKRKQVDTDDEVVDDVVDDAVGDGVGDEQSNHSGSDDSSEAQDRVTTIPHIAMRSKTTFDLQRLLPFAERPSFGFDIGGSLVKICFFETNDSALTASNRARIEFLKQSLKYGKTGIRDKSLSFAWRNGVFHFIHFHTYRMKEAVALFKQQGLVLPGEHFYATGGGAFKYGRFLKEQLGVAVKKGDELHCLLRGLNFLLTYVPDELCYMEAPNHNVRPGEKPHKIIPYDITKEGSIFPYILVNIGSGVSILRVDSPSQFERVSGTCIGGGTYWGLCRLTVSDNITFQEAFEMASQGDPNKVNMTVSDIYGGGYRNFNLPGDVVASAFGKMIGQQHPLKTSVDKRDVARSLLDMVAMNVAQLGYLNAMRYDISRIIFAGNFLRQNAISRAVISYAIHFWSQGQMRACFLKHEGYFGSIGVFLMPDEESVQDSHGTTEEHETKSDDESNTP